MFSIVIVGNSQSFVKEGKFITPRGYDVQLRVYNQLKVNSFELVVWSYRIVTSEKQQVKE